jgi:signal transduction histidine kinase
MFTIKNKAYEISVINQAAKEFLRVSTLEPDEKISVADVMSKFDPGIKLGEQIQKVFISKESVTVDNVKVFDRAFRIFINPVFLPGSKNSSSNFAPPPTELLGVALIMRDITAEKKLEKVRADFTDMMVHELRAPTTAIKGAASLLVSNMLGEPERAKMPRIILDSANDMLLTISDFLDVAKLDEGKFKLNLEKRDIAKVLAEHVEVFSYAAREKNISINLDKNATLPEFFFDAVRIGQVINNLLSNSIKFTDNGGKIDIKIDQKDGQIFVMVLDNGIGVPEEKKPLLFTKFGQINQRLGQGASSGLGLFISREIVEAHGGKIWLESPIAEGQGTRVSFTLPIVLEEKEAVTQPAVHLAN